MPSPFPGMDPYLEGAEWISVHAELGSEIARQLAPRLRPKYIARTVRRFVTEIPDDVAISGSDIYPDNLSEKACVSLAIHGGKEVLRGLTPQTPPFQTVSDVIVSRAAAEGAMGAGALAVTPPLQLATVMPVRVPQVSIEIRDVARRELVTAIKILSPTNKRGEGYREYLDKRQRILLSAAHLVEIDLLRSGQRVPMQEPLPPAPYFVFVGRAERRPIVDVWPIQLADRLPQIPIPLLAGDPDVSLDLQQALDTIYDALSYDLSVDYTRPSDVPLEGAVAAWARERLKAAGVLPRESTSE